MKTKKIIAEGVVKPKRKYTKKVKSAVIFAGSKPVIDTRPKNEYDIYIDDSMWGNPLGGILQGAYSFKLEKFITEVVDVKHFQSPNFEQKTYLLAIANASLKMVKELNAEKTDKILVCRGYCNNLVDRILIANGFTNVSRGVIGEPLQTLLEKQAWEYVKSIGYENYYDPKGMSKFEIAKSFNAIIKWVVDNNRFDLCKTGWGYFIEEKWKRNNGYRLC
jgi:rhodanese-related sulfurtransferase